MNPSKFSFILAVSASLAFGGAAQAGPATYQVTGPVLQVTDSLIVVAKGKEKWELARDANTKVTGDLKIGSKVTITYTMTATVVVPKDVTEKAKVKASKEAAEKAIKEVTPPPN
jgi:hypothetical protein